ncbi:MAG: RluA family pseudouridine synthase [Oscillospiraceae bacterium]|nr:RluA family pseudouridine synthase [Oscillospiraceae bacterium]
MREMKIGKNDAGQRADHFLMKALPALGPSLRQKFLRTKYIKRNGARLSPGDKLEEGDVLTFYISDAFFEKPDPETAYRSIEPKLTVVYEDENILIADKKAGMLVHSDDSGDENTLINHIKAYLFRTGQWDPEKENSFVPALANRIDRNTSGLVLAAKNAEALRILNEKIRAREIEKSYYCVIHGFMQPSAGRLDSFIERDLENKRVYSGKTRTGDARTASTLYRTVARSGELSLLECRLLTGRTHQIRAQFAQAGHPLLGDGKYGKNELDRRYGRKYQALHSYKVEFAFPTDAGALAYLKGKVFTTGKPDFITQYFPDAKLDESGKPKQKKK